MITAIYLFWSTAEEGLYVSAYPYTSLVLAKLFKGLHIGIMLVLVLKNPGVVSEDPTDPRLYITHKGIGPIELGKTR